MSNDAFAIHHPALALASVLLTLGVAGASAGDLDAPAAPSSSDSAMYSLQNLYDRLDTGATGTKRPGPFVEPSSGPPAGTMATLDAIMAKMPVVDATNGAAPGDVLSGKTYWGLTASGWGPRTGTSYPPGCTCQSPAYIHNAANGGTRWCVNGNGTVTDLLGATVDGKTKGRCLVWLQDANWGGAWPWRSATSYDDAHTRAGILKTGLAAGLSDGSVEGDWRLPTKSEFQALITPPERILSSSPGPFSGVQSNDYWSSTSSANFAQPAFAWNLNLFNGFVNLVDKSYSYYVWPVRGGQ